MFRCYTVNLKDIKLSSLAYYHLPAFDSFVKWIHFLYLRCCWLKWKCSMIFKTTQMLQYYPLVLFIGVICPLTYYCSCNERACFKFQNFSYFINTHASRSKDPNWTRLYIPLLFTFFFMASAAPHVELSFVKLSLSFVRDQDAPQELSRHYLSSSTAG